MNIIQAASPNHDARKTPINMLVLHYTGMETGRAALDRMRSAEAKVSAHYMVEEDGRIFQLVDEASRAWHAGVSSWNGETDLNSASIGIEIVNGGHDFGLPEFPDVQIETVLTLSQAILSRHNIPQFNIVGHSDIAPARKQDPGEKFPWQKLSTAGIGYWPGDIGADQRALFELGSSDRGVAILQRGLAFIGYGIEVNGKFDVPTQQVIIALHRRYRPSKVDGIVDVQTMEIVTKLADAKKIVGSAAV
jgi:N-acetylmuramoyl-L-alanine amidase